jgi:agmatine deiminase
MKSSMTPRQLGYSFPPEWRRHKGTWLSWPRPEGISFPGKYHTIPENMARIIREIAAHEPAHINVPDADYAEIVKSRLTEYGCPLRNLHFHCIKTNECWCRDHGPAFLLRRESGKRGGETAIVDWKFNAWGGKFAPCDDDNAVPSCIAKELDLPVFKPGIVMEGGSVDFNGAGTVLTTEACLLNKNRNPRLSRQKIEWYLQEYYGQEQICWLGQGLVGDDTDGHVDDLARFIGPRTIVTAVEDDPSDVNYAALRDNRRRLALLRDPAGRPFEIIELPMPGAVAHAGQRLPATYVNFCFVNGALLVPTYRYKQNDRQALEILQRLLPRRHIVGIDCVELIWGRGSIHCLTQQWPYFARR